MITPAEIFLIDIGDEVVWCDDRNPSGNVCEKDVVKYVKADMLREILIEGRSGGWMENSPIDRKIQKLISTT
jgi:hypothetical protein